MLDGECDRQKINTLFRITKAALQAEYVQKVDVTDALFRARCTTFCRNPSFFQYRFSVILLLSDLGYQKCLVGHCGVT